MRYRNASSSRFFIKEDEGKPQNRIYEDFQAKKILFVLVWFDLYSPKSNVAFKFDLKYIDFCGAPGGWACARKYTVYRGRKALAFKRASTWEL
jgi:hypothetical protein